MHPHKPRADGIAQQTGTHVPLLTVFLSTVAVVFPFGLALHAVPATQRETTLYTDHTSDTGYACRRVRLAGMFCKVQNAAARMPKVRPLISTFCTDHSLPICLDPSPSILPCYAGHSRQRFCKVLAAAAPADTAADLKQLLQDALQAPQLQSDSSASGATTPPPSTAEASADLNIPGSLDTKELDTSNLPAPSSPDQGKLQLHASALGRYALPALLFKAQWRSCRNCI